MEPTIQIPQAGPKIKINDYLKFSKNWNSKLDCECFSTIRIYNPKRYVLKDHYAVLMKNPRGIMDFNGVSFTYIGVAQLVAETKIQFQHITDQQALLDIGQPAEYLKNMLGNMYQKYLLAKKGESLFGIYYFKWIDKY